MRVALFVVLCLPFLYLSYRVYLDDILDPIKYIYSLTGISAIVLLYITTTLSIIKKRLNLIKYRRMVGLYSLFYALLHFANFIVLDMELDIVFAFEEMSDKRFIYLGVIALAILIPMGITSPNNLYRKYGKYHKAIYIAIILATTHYIMGQKSLDIYEYMYLAIALIIALAKLYQLYNKYNMKQNV